VVMITKQQAAIEAIDFLKKNTVGILATCTPEGVPFASPVYYGVYDDFTIYFITSSQTQKYKNISANNRVSFCVGTGPLYEVVNIHGTAQLVDDEHREESIQFIRKHVTSPMATWPIVKINALKSGALELYKISPTHVSYFNLESDDQLESMINFIYEIVP